jgi:hypothetical protein
MDVSNLPEAVQTLETHRGELFLQYIVLDKTASEVISILKQEHDFDVT